MDTMTTISEVLNHLQTEGYTTDFNLKDNCLLCHGNSLRIHPDDFVIDKHYRFEGISDPGDEAVIYAISSIKHNIKGTLLNGYGIYSEKAVDDLIDSLKENTTLMKKLKISSIEEKFNEATLQRPEGDRLLDAPLVEMDIQRYKEQIKQEETWKNSDRNAITIFKSAGMRIVLVALHKAAKMKTHTAPVIISIQVIEGQILFHTEQKSVELIEDQMLVLHAGIPHSVQALVESVFLLTVNSGMAGR
jgi:quercetin dioxygenase-like cupin family protein